IDVYCGVGVMTLLAAKKCKLALGIESVKSAISDAEANAQRNGVRNAMFLAAPAATALSGGSSKVEMIATSNLIVMLDPPRAGCGVVRGGLPWWLINSQDARRTLVVVAEEEDVLGLADDVRALFRLPEVWTPRAAFPVHGYTADNDADRQVALHDWAYGRPG